MAQTMENSNQVRLTTVPRIPNSPICPVRAFSNLLALVPEGENAYLFQAKYKHYWIPLTDTRVTKHNAGID